MFACRGRKRFVRPLQNPLRSDIDPAPRGHLAVHHQAQPVQLVEALPIAPMPDQIGIANQHARRVLVRAEDADRLARLHEQRFIRFERLQ